MRGLTLLIVSALMVLAIGCGGSTATQVSPDVASYVTDGMTYLVEAAGHGDEGRMVEAVAAWASVGPPPAGSGSTDDDVVLEQFASYSDDVRSYIEGDSSVDAQKLDQDRADVQYSLGQ